MYAQEYLLFIALMQNDRQAIDKVIDPNRQDLFYYIYYYKNSKEQYDFFKSVNEIINRDIKFKDTFMYLYVKLLAYPPCVDDITAPPEAEESDE